jgi:hypothetical protein
MRIGRSVPAGSHKLTRLPGGVTSCPAGLAAPSASAALGAEDAPPHALVARNDITHQAAILDMFFHQVTRFLALARQRLQ